MSNNLNLHHDIFTIAYSSDEEWLQLRRQGIGGSDAAAVMGLSKYKSPLQCYRDKVEERDTNADNVHTRKGKTLEPVIREQYVIPYMEAKGYNVEHPDVMLINRRCHWLRANLDGLAIPKDLNGKTFADNIVIEIKWVSEYAESRWFGDEYCGIPAEYYAQVQHYMCVTGASKAIVCALFDSSWEMHYFEVPYDLKFAVKLLDATKSFYERNLKANVPPRITISLDKEDELQLLSTTPAVTTPSEELREKCRQYTALKDELAALEKEVQKLHDDIFADYLEGKVPDGQFKMSVSKRTTVRVDQHRLKTMYPDVYEDCKSTNEYTVHTVKRI